MVYRKSLSKTYKNLESDKFLCQISKKTVLIVHFSNSNSIDDYDDYSSDFEELYDKDDTIPVN